MVGDDEHTGTPGMAGMSALPEIRDNDVYTGREVKALLALVRQGGEEVRWVDVDRGAAIMQEKPDTVRRQCSRWSRMADPPVRVHKKGDRPRSPWLLDESDCWKIRRGKGLGPALEAVPVADTEDETVAYWCQRATANL